MSSGFMPMPVGGVDISINGVLGVVEKLTELGLLPPDEAAAAPMMLGMFAEFTPSFVRRYADLGPEIAKAAAAYATDVKARRFPAPENVFRPKTGRGKKGG